MIPMLFPTEHSNVPDNIKNLRYINRKDICNLRVKNCIVAIEMESKLGDEYIKVM